MQQSPRIAIYQNEKTLKFKVFIDGQEIPRLKSFTVAVNNDFPRANAETPYYKVEQYLLRQKADQMLTDRNGEGRENGD